MGQRVDPGEADFADDDLGLVAIVTFGGALGSSPLPLGSSRSFRLASANSASVSTPVSRSPASR